MSWLSDVQKALCYIENNILDDLTPYNVAEHICASKSNFDCIFGIVTGFSVSEYIRLRKLSLAGRELQKEKGKIIDIALKYGYDSPESFTKAFSRFHGITPSEAKNDQAILKTFVPLTIEINIKGGYIMSRRIIPNVEKIYGYQNQTENFMFPSCMRSAMSALGEDDSLDFMFFAGASGDFFTQTWLSPKWKYNDSFSNVCHHTEIPIKNAFEACGYDYEYIPKSEIEKDKSKYIKKIVESIDNGIPVLSFGIVGPPACSIIFGYDENGDVLIGWSQFTDEPHPDTNGPHMECIPENFFQKRNGLDSSRGLIFIRKKLYNADIADGIRKSLKNIPNISSIELTKEEADSAQSYKLVCGKKAFDKWADSLLDDSFFQNEEALGAPLDTYMSCIVQIATNIHYVDCYLDRATDLCPDISELTGRLKIVYENLKESLQKIIELQGGFFPYACKSSFLKRKFREKLSGFIRELGKIYTKVPDTVKSYDF